MKRNLLKFALCAMALLPMGAWAQTTISSKTTWMFDQYYITGTALETASADEVLEYDGLYFSLASGKTLTAVKNTLENDYVDNEVTIFPQGTYTGLEFNGTRNDKANVVANSTSKPGRLSFRTSKSGTVYVLCSGGYDDNRTILAYIATEGTADQGSVTLTSGNKLVVLKFSVTGTYNYHVITSYAGKMGIYGVKFVPSAEAKITMPTANISQGYATYSSSHDWYVPTNFLAYYATSVGDNKVQMTEIAAGKIVPAGEAVIIKRVSGSATEVTPTNALTTDDNYSTKLVNISGNLLKPNLMAYALPTSGTAADNSTYYNYTLAYESSAPVFKHVKDASTSLAANKAYLRTTVNVTSGASAPALNLVFGGTTNISESVVKDVAGDGQWYTLSGQRVTAPGKGIYIKNGKKYIIK